MLVQKNLQHLSLRFPFFMCCRRRTLNFYVLSALIPSKYVLLAVSSYYLHFEDTTFATTSSKRLLMLTVERAEVSLKGMPILLAEYWQCYRTKLLLYV
jgi:hypothetical protein